MRTLNSSCAEKDITSFYTTAQSETNFTNKLAFCVSSFEKRNELMKEFLYIVKYVIIINHINNFMNVLYYEIIGKP